jgi:hypothetical protein
MSMPMSMPESPETEEPTSSPTPESEPESESDPEPDIDTSTIKCTWKASFDDSANILKACKKLNDEFSVPYACDGNGHKMQVCCTVSIIEEATFEKFGQCTKI